MATTLANAVTAFGWGNHAGAGYLTSYDETDPLSIHLGTTSVASITELSNLSITESQISDLGSYLTDLSGGLNAILENSTTTNATTTSLHVSGYSTLSTTTMAYESKIGSVDLSSYFSIESTNLSDPGDLGFSVNQIPLIRFHNSSDVLNNNTGAINNGLIIVEDLYGSGNPEDDSPNITFAANDISDILNGSIAQITFSTTSAELSFSGATAYNFDVPINESSDRNLKTNISDLNYGLDDILALRPVSFDYLRTGKNSLGFIAQEVKDIIPEIVSGEEGSYGLHYSIMTALLTKGIQEQQQQIERLSDQFSLIFNASTTLSLDENGFLDTDFDLAPTSTAQSLTAERLSAGYSIIKNFFAERLVAMIGVFDFVKTKVLETETLRVERGMEIKDAVTGETYCVTIVNGDWQKAKGECLAPQILAPVESPAPAINNSNSELSPVPEKEEVASSTTPAIEEEEEEDSTETELPIVETLSEVESLPSSSDPISSEPTVPSED